MGSFFSRTSSRSRGTKQKLKTRQHDALGQNEASIVTVPYSNESHTDYNNTHGEAYEKWNQTMEQQSQMGTNNDPPGAPITYRSQYDSINHGGVDQSWSTTQNSNKSYYQMSLAPRSSMNYDQNEYSQSNVQNGFLNSSSQGMTDDRPSKRVQFDLTAQQVASQPQPLPRTPLTGTQSWHEPSVTTRENSVGTTGQNERLINTHSMHQSSSSIPQNSNSQSSKMLVKPIYVSIDHQAMIDERGLPAVTKRTHKTADRHSTEIINGQMENPRLRSQTHHSHRSVEPIESNNHRVILQAKTSNSQRSTTMTTSTSVLPSANVSNRQMSPSLNSNLSEHGSRTNRSRTNRSQGTHSEKSAPSSHASSSSSSRTQSNSQFQPQSQSQSTRQAVSRTDSPLRSEPNASTRRVENRSAGSPMMRIPISQHQNHHHHHQHHQHHQQSSRHHHSNSTQRNNSPLRTDSRSHQRSAETHATASPMMTIPISQQTQRHRPMGTPSDRMNATRTRV